MTKHSMLWFFAIIAVFMFRSPLQNDERKFGAQFVVDETDELVRVEEAMLLASTDLSVQEAAVQLGVRPGKTVSPQ